MRFPASCVVLLAPFVLAVPTLASAQQPSPSAPARLLAQREVLALTPDQVRELSLLSMQVRRYEETLILAPSKPWIAAGRGRSEEEAARRAFALLSADQKQMVERAKGI